MTADLALLIGIIVLLIVASAFFSSAETALTAASDARMRQLASKGNRRARLVERLRDDREGLIGSILIGNNAVNVIASALATSCNADRRRVARRSRCSASSRRQSWRLPSSTLSRRWLRRC